MSEDIIKRRQLLKEKLEGKLSDNDTSLKQQRVVKGNPTRLHIPTIFQLNKSTENLSSAPKLTQNINLSRSTGNIHKDSSLKLTNFEDDATKESVKPARKLSSSFSMKLDEDTSQNKSKLQFSKSFSVTKSENNTTGRNEETVDPNRKVSSINYPDNKFFSPVEYPQEDNPTKTNPIVVAGIIKKTEDTKNNLEDNPPATTEEGLVMLRRKLTDLRASKIKRTSLDTSPTMCFNFSDRSSNPESPILQKLEKHPTLKRSGSRAGFIVRDEMNQNEENENKDPNSLYDNLQLKNTPVQNGSQDCENEEKFKNNIDIVDSLYGNLKLKNTPLDKPSDIDFVTKDNSEDVTFRNETAKKIEVNNSLYGKFEELQFQFNKEVLEDFEEKYNIVFQLLCVHFILEMPVRELPDELKTRAKAEINEDPVRTQEDLDHIKEWLKRQPHIHARTDDQWLVSFLRGCKFSLERTKEKLDFFYTMRTMVPEFFKDRDPSHEDVQAVIKQGVFLPLLNSGSVDQPRVIIIRSGIYDPQKCTFQQVLKANMMLMDLSLLDDEISVINGVHAIKDMSGITLAHIGSPSIMKKAIMCYQEAYPYRIKGIHFVNTPVFFETIFGMLRPFLTEKMKTRVTVHGNDMESLYKVIPQEILPKEYGGKGDSIQTIIDSGLKNFEEYRDWFLADEQYKSDESKRPGKPKTSDEMFGIEGSFRKLNVD